MDSITHIALGAIIGDALAGRQLGKKAMLLGAVAQSLPDVDFIAGFWLDTAHDVMAHRGITHSLLFVAVVAVLFAWVGRRIWRGAGMSFGHWLLFAALELFIHIFIDAFNAYGTGWFEPFSHYRVSFNILFVADPFFSIWPGISFLVLLILRRGSRWRGFWIRFGLILSCCYLYYCLLNKYRIDRWAVQSLEAHQIHYKRYFTTPTPLNNWLWYIVAEDSTGYHTGYLSLLTRVRKVQYHYFPRNDSLLNVLRSRGDVRALMRFCQGYYTAEQWGDTLVFNDLRFGQIRGWEDGQARFVFHYYLHQPGDNEVILQRGRFAGWNRQTFRTFVRKIEGD
ncbi:MAG: metal-dependent hydrolase [Chitinophagaceae bacterium]|nr:metal-dependent hydrolase [Chitinophagaceae bacterium]